MKLYSIILAFAACAVAVPLVPVSNQSSNITDANPNSIETLLSNVYNATNATEEKAVAAEQILHSARLDVVSSEGFEKLKNAEHYAKLAREAADAAIAASDRAAAAAQEMAEISKANPSPSSSDAVARALAAADRANQAKIRAMFASEYIYELHDERFHLQEIMEKCAISAFFSIGAPFSYAMDRIDKGRPLIPTRAFGRQLRPDTDDRDRYKDSYYGSPSYRASEDRAAFEAFVFLTVISSVFGLGCSMYLSHVAHKRASAVNATLMAFASEPITISVPIAY